MYRDTDQDNLADLDAEQARERASRYASLLDLSPDAILVVNPDGTICQVNHRVADLFGYEPDQLVGRRIDVLVPADVRPRHDRYREGFHARPTERPMGTLTLRAVHHDGHEIPVDVSLDELDSGEAVVYVRDASARLDAEKARHALGEAERARRHALQINDSIVQGLAAALYATDLDRDAVKVAIETTLHMARTMMVDLLGEHADELVSGSLVRSEPAASVISHKVELPEPDESTDRDAVRVVIADDSEDLRTILAARLSRHHRIDVVATAADGDEALAAIAEHQPDVVLLDLAMPNVDGFEVLAKTTDQPDRPHIIVLTGFEAPQMRQQALDAGADGYYTKGTDLGIIADHVAALARGDHGAAPYRPLRPVRSDTVGVLAHELRAPLAAASGAASMLAEHDLPADAREPIRAALVRTLDHSLAVVDKISLAHRANRGELDIVLRTTDLATLVRDLVSDLEQSLGRAVETSLPDELLVDVDPVRVRQLVTNLLSNAAKFSPPDQPIRVQVRSDGVRASLAVTDRGPGVDPADVDRLFEQFVKSPNSPGMGLGLFLCRAIADAHGGTLTCRPSDNPPGATFEFQLSVTAQTTTAGADT